MTSTRKPSPAAQIAQIVGQMNVVELNKLAQELGWDTNLASLAELVEQYKDDDGRPKIVLPAILDWYVLSNVNELNDDGTIRNTFNPSAIRYIKAIREVLGIGLTEAKQIVDKAVQNGQGYDRNKQPVTLLSHDDEAVLQQAVDEFAARGITVELR